MRQSFAGRAWKGLKGRLKIVFTNPYSKVDIGWSKLKYLKHLSNGKERVHRLHGHDLVYTSATELLHGLKEIFIEEIYQQDLGPEPFIIDCGANIGLSVIYLKEKYPKARIIAFEPDETNFTLLKRNIDSFGFTNVELRKEAIWIEDTELNFSSDSSMSSRIDEYNAETTIRVKATRLRNLLDRPVDFLKIDIEGAEYRVMMDISDRLVMVDNLFLEYHGNYDQAAELSEILQKLSGNNFHFYIKEAASIYAHPFLLKKDPAIPYDVQLNIFCKKSIR